MLKLVLRLYLLALERNLGDLVADVDGAHQQRFLERGLVRLGGNAHQKYARVVVNVRKVPV